LNAIAAVLAPTRQITTPPTTLAEGTPSAARNIEANPNGIANTVCSNLINSAHRKIENFTRFTLPHFTVEGLGGRWKGSSTPTSFQLKTGLQGQNEAIEPFGNTDRLLPQSLRLIFIE
jgi:hypothetical protein